ncbi:nuclear pore complex protein Nup98-Nup96 isoform X2 [Pieris rapae]|uniref:nuclear pore complex protein Nup98-Nup96 isoform X2 n=1 Tax=Pieris rapae TaxID=64459 RepID=UPI001E27E020|nr:nuclear pore complex protein Nup98-Nup96 isoform X2 [Pieris rapae]
MFQKQTFGNTTSGFGSFNAGANTSSPFGGFKPATGTSAFGAAPAFGASPANTSTAGGGLFGQTNTSGGLFGGAPAANPTPAFGSTGFGSFGASTTTGGLFGANTSSTGLFGNTQNNTAFGAKPAGFGFGSTPTAGPSTGGLFSSGASTSGGLFSQPTNTLGGGAASGGLFSTNTGAFGQQQQAAGTAHVKYHPVVGTDVVVKGGASQTVNIRHHCITCMKEYDSKSLEELRLEDYTAGRKGSSSGVFGFQQPADNTVKPIFNSSFGQPATTTAPSLFGGGSLGTTSAFGQTNTFSFGNTGQNTTTTGLFGANKSAFGATPTTGTGLFGATTTQAPAFGTTTSTFGFGPTTQNQQSGGLFGAKSTTGAFGSTATSGFGSFGSGGLFGAKTQQTTAPTFGTGTPAFGATSSGFGTNTSSSLFGGGSTFGKPATTQSTFGFNSQPTLGTGLGTGLGSSFQAKPNAFGTTLGGGSSLFPQQNNTFQTGLNTGLGGSLFNNNSSLGGTGLGLGQNNANTSLMPGGGLGSSVGSNVHEQILTLAARPYGDSPLFKDLLPDTSTTAEDALKPTNPAAVKAVLDSSNAAYRVTSPTGGRLKVVPRTVTQDKKSLFDGLEESDASLEDRLTLKPSRKRLVLRPNTNLDNSLNNRSLGEPQVNGTSQVDGSVAAERERDDFPSKSKERLREQNSDIELRTDKQNGWPSRHSWNEEKPIDSETPRLYPNLDKEMPALESERRASWLTTKPLRKPQASNAESPENSVRELGVKESSTSTDKENIDTFYNENVSTHDAPVEAPPHPAGVKLTRPGYYTIPSLEEMIKYIGPDGKCVVPHLTIGRKNYGNVYYDCEIDVTDMDLDAIVHFLNKEVIVYPEDSEKPPLGEGLNRRAIVTLDRVWPRDKTEKRPVTEPERLLKMDYEGKLRRVCDKYDTKFIEYRAQTGSWVFRVEHFSKYGISDSDEEEELAPQVLKRQLVNQSLQKAAATVTKPVVPVTSALGGVGTNIGLGSNLTLGSNLGLGGLGFSSSVGDEDMFLQTSLNLMNGSKGFEMDTTEDNADATSLYQDNRVFGMKSPTSELARLEHRQSHNVQLMKASLYADAEMEDDVSISTGDQMVPHATASVISLPPTSVSHMEMAEEAPEVIEEPVARPLIVNPHTVILKYHRKVPPFKKTIAGRLNADCLADMSVCRARHSRVSFGPSNALVFSTTHDVISELPRKSDLCELGRYVLGRSDEDWSEAVMARVQIGQADSKAVLDTLRRQLQSLLDFSDPEDATRPFARLVVQESPIGRKQLLEKLLEDACKEEYSARFGVSSSYSVQVWKLCEALWGEDLLNDGVPGTDEQSIVSRHEDLLKWLKNAVAEITDDELSQPVDVDPEDEKDGHSARVWTLLLGGRILEACKLCRENRDFNMAILISQAYGDPYFKTLLSRQLNIWKECGADSLISSHKRAILSLLAGRSPTAELEALDWLRVLNVCARYLCPQIPTLEQIVRTYEELCSRESNVDLTTVPEESVNMRLPTPDYQQEYMVSIDSNGTSRRILDLRYELIRARAFNTRPCFQPAAYTPHPIDYSLSFLLGCWFGKPTIRSIVGLAEQLEGYGEWHLAVQVLFYHPDDKIRAHLIEELIGRHAPAEADSSVKARLEFVEKLGVPQKCLLLARAHRAKYEHRPQLEAECLVGAGAWNAAHSVLVEQLLPEVVLSDNVKSVQPIIEKLSEAARRNEVSGWESGGEALYHYIYVCDEIRGLVSAAEGQEAEDRSSVACRLEALTPRLAAACRALTLFRSKSPRALAARAEMGARLVQLALAGGQVSAHLAALLQDLDLPPDCAAHAQYKITSDLSDQASEFCLESTQSSPLSSHRKGERS